MSALTIVITAEMFDAGADALQRHYVFTSSSDTQIRRMVAADVFSAMVQEHNRAQAETEHAPVMTAAANALDEFGYAASERAALREFVLAVVREQSLKRD